MRKILLTTLAAILVTNPAVACISIFSSCADEELPMSASSFEVHARGGPTLINPSANGAILQSAAQGCARRGFSQFVVASTQEGYVNPPMQVFQAYGYGNGIYGNSVAMPARRSTNAVIQCVRQGGVSVRQYLNAND